MADLESLTALILAGRVSNMIPGQVSWTDPRELVREALRMAIVVQDECARHETAQRQDINPSQTELGFTDTPTKKNK